MTFQFDTSGHVEVERKNGRAWVVTWSDLSPFTQGYIEALLRDTPAIGPLSNLRWPAFSDLTPEALARIIADCEAWRSEFTGRTAETSADRADMGREFWRIRQAGRRGTFPPLTVQLGDDGKVRFA